MLFQCNNGYTNTTRCYFIVHCLCSFTLILETFFLILVMVWPSTVSPNTKDVMNLQNKLGVSDEI